MSRNQLMGMPTTNQFRHRAARRGFPADVAGFVMQWGTEVHACDAVSLTVFERDLPRDLQGTEMAVRARDWVVVVGRGGSLITCYRRRHATRLVRRKADAQPRRGRRRIGQEPPSVGPVAPVELRNGP